MLFYSPPTLPTGEYEEFGMDPLVGEYHLVGVGYAVYKTNVKLEGKQVWGAPFHGRVE